MGANQLSSKPPHAEVVRHIVERNVLSEAAALSFFSLNAPSFHASFGPQRTETQVRYTVARLRPRHRPLLRVIRHDPRVWRMLLPLLDGAVPPGMTP